MDASSCAVVDVGGRGGRRALCDMPCCAVQADVPMANAALGACDRGKDGDSAWRIYSLMHARDLLMDSITFKALISALSKVDQWQRCCAVFVHAVKTAVALEAVSVMVLLFALTRAGRWDVAERVFLCAYEATCDTAALRANNCEARPPSAAGDTPAATSDGAITPVTADAASMSGTFGATPFLPQHGLAPSLRRVIAALVRVQGRRRST